MYSNVLFTHTPKTLLSLSLKSDHPSRELRDLQTSPPQNTNTHTPPERHNDTTHPSPCKHTQTRDTQTTPPPAPPILWAAHILYTQTQMHIQYTNVCKHKQTSSHMFKHTVYTVGKCNNPHRGQLTDLTFIVRAASMNILKRPLNHYSGTKKGQ